MPFGQLCPRRPNGPWKFVCACAANLNPAKIKNKIKKPETYPSPGTGIAVCNIWAALVSLIDNISFAKPKGSLLALT